MKKAILIVLLIFTNLLAEERIVTLSPSVNEIVYALGMGKNVLANTKFCDYPEESKKVKKVGGYANTSLEKILAVKPTVTIAQNYDEKLLKNLEALNIKTLVFKTDSINDIKFTINKLGDYFKKEQKAKEISDSIDNALLSVENITINKKILIVISPKETLSNQIFVSGNYLYFEDIIKASGNKNAFQSKSKAQPVVNTEKIIKMNPDIIILLAAFFEYKDEELKKVIGAWENLPINASKNKNIYAINKDYAGIPSNRVVYFIKDFKKILENVRDK
ncbi:MAG: ABC transporter substrate-binding protein [Arcobacter sp.]|uniref:ABC transporter substrate-binding protein n=1 Tax=Arcobacter sp. TaxID=1872629 RepID=UPI003B00AB18